MKNAQEIRCRFAPSVPVCGGEFLHIGHVAMLTYASNYAESNGYPLDIRLDVPTNGIAAVDIRATLDIANLVFWLKVPVRQMYVTSDVEYHEIMQTAKGDWSLYNSLTRWQLSSGYDDLVRYKTIIIRGNEFANPEDRSGASRDQMLNFWGLQPVAEINYPLLLLKGKKVAKSGGNAPHWRCLQKFGADKVKRYFCDKVREGKDYEMSWVL